MRFALCAVLYVCFISAFPLGIYALDNKWWAGVWAQFALISVFVVSLLLLGSS